MKVINKKLLLCVLVLVFSVSFVSAMPSAVNPQPLAQAAEAHAIGGDACSRAVGLGVGLAVGALSPCSIICAVAAWYDLALIAAYC